MPKKAKELGPLAVRRLVDAGERGLYAMGGVPGLHLQVHTETAASWILRAMVGGRRRDIGLGGFDAVTLSAARDAARSLRAKIAAGIDPVAERHAAKAALASTITFDEAAERLIAVKAPGFKNAKHLAQWRSTLATYASPVIGRLPVDQVDVQHVVAILRPIWETKTETAKRVQGRIEAVLDWATVSKHRTGDNPARWKGGLSKLFAAPGKVAKKAHQPALPFGRMHEFMHALRQREGIGSRALELEILTATRPGEARGARWDEIDLDAGIWTIPAARMKASAEHVVPLSPRAVDLLRRQPRHAGNALVFPAARGGELSDAALAKVVRLMHDASLAAGGTGYLDPKEGRVSVPHGFRSTFRDWAAETTSYPRDVVEMALAHTVANKVEAAYRRGKLLAKRTRMMEDWSKFIDTATITGNVTPIRRKAK